MQPVKIVIRDMESSPALEDHIRRKAEKLTHYFQRINHCQVVIEVPQKHKRQGKLFRVCIDLTVPGKELVVNRKFDEDIYIAIRDAFHAVVRKLESYASIRRGEVKNHESSNLGYVSKLFPEEGYGFIQSVEGMEYYFSLTNVYFPNFDSLAIGDIVQFIGARGAEGMQAHRITKEKKAIILEEAAS
jgi:ribosomal subunit interface protein